MLNDNSPIPCFILGVKGKFRASDLIKQLPSFGFEPKIIYGLDAGDPRNVTYLKSCVDQRIAKLTIGRHLSLGEVACAQGHREIYREFLRSGNEWTLVFEDDAIVLSDLVELKVALSCIKEPSIVQIYKSSEINPARNLWTLKEKNVKFCRMDSKWDLIRKFESTNGTYAYFINRSAALVAVKLSEGKKIIDTADWPILWRNQVNFWETTVDFVSTLNDSLIDRQNNRGELISNAQGHPSKSDIIRFVRSINAANPFRMFSYFWHGYPVRVIFFGKVVVPLRRRLFIYAKAKR
jgi:GR25 family glycosyltransferase involved in LPS biosynthesis